MLKLSAAVLPRQSWKRLPSISNPSAPWTWRHSRWHSVLAQPTGFQISWKRLSRIVTRVAGVPAAHADASPGGTAWPNADEIVGTPVARRSENSLPSTVMSKPQRT
jgi:hypothetical protein